MRPRLFTLIILLNAAFQSVADAEEPGDYYSPKSVRKYADFLYKQEDYLRAAGEYQRYLFYRPRESDDIHYKIALCYRLGGEFERATGEFETFLHAYPDSRLSSNVYYQIGVSYFLMKQFQQSLSYLNAALPRVTDVRQRAESQELIGLCYLMQKRWIKADKVFNELRESDVAEVGTRAAFYHNYAVQGTRLPNSSPFLAGILSTIIPGAGRFYTGRIGDALTSFLTVGFAGWQAYDGFRRNGTSSAKGWVFGTLGGVFYVSNIYGSVLSARVYNRSVEDEYLATLSIKLSY